MNHIKYINHCLTLAKKGSGLVSPNPLVGCIIVKNNKIISTGYHRKLGNNHAEINAIKSCTHSPNEATLYVNLEPCCHHGKTPPCVDAIIKAGIKKVVVGTLDSNPKVSGQGIEKLKSNGIEVIVGVLEKECKELNEKYFYWITEQKPFIFLKVALSKNFLLAPKNRSRVQVTSKESIKKVHNWRSQYDAVLMGTGTIVSDNPKLTIREVKGKQPYRIVLDRSKKLEPSKYHVFTDEYSNKTIVLTNKKIVNNKYTKELESRNVSVVNIDCKTDKLDIKKILDLLPELDIYSVMIEGGVELTKEIVGKKLANKITVFIGDKIIEDGDSPFESRSIIDLEKELINKNIKFIKE